MHLATYSKGDAGRMLAHYERAIGPRDHIDPDGRVVDLWALLDTGSGSGSGSGSARERFESLCDGVEMGAKTRPLADWVATVPEGWTDSPVRLLAAVTDILAERVGLENVVGAWAHLDEPGARPHVHFAFVPRVEAPVMTNDKTRPLLWTERDERKNPAHVAGTQKVDGKGTPRWERVPKVGADGRPVTRVTASASKMFSRAEMRDMHAYMERELCRTLGVARVGMVLPESQRGRKELSRLDHADYAAATAELARADAEAGRAAMREAVAKRRQRTAEGELDGTKAALEAAQGELAATTREAAAMARERDSAASEVAALERQRVETRGILGGLQTDVAKKRAQAADLDGRISEKTADLAAIEGRIGDFSKKEDAARQRLEWVQGEVRDLVESVEEAGPIKLARFARGEGGGEALRAAREREQAAGRANKELRGRLAALQAERDGVERRIAGLEQGNRGLRGRLERLRGSVEDAWRRLLDAADAYPFAWIEGVGERTAYLLNYIGLKAYAGAQPLRERLDTAAEASRAQEAQQPADKRRRGRHL